LQQRVVEQQQLPPPLHSCCPSPQSRGPELKTRWWKVQRMEALKRMKKWWRVEVERKEKFRRGRNIHVRGEAASVEFT
jgi:hypothetical protein